APALAVIPGALLGQDTETPILRLFREHKALVDECNTLAAQDWVTDEYLSSAYFQPADSILAAMLALPSTCAADFAAKLCAWTYSGDVYIDQDHCPEIWAEA